MSPKSRHRVLAWPRCSAVTLCGQHGGRDLSYDLSHGLHFVRELDCGEVDIGCRPTQLMGREQHSSLEHELAPVRRVSETEQEALQRIQPQVFGSRTPVCPRLLPQCQEGAPSDSGFGRSVDLSSSSILAVASQQDLECAEHGRPRSREGFSHAHQIGRVTSPA